MGLRGIEVLSAQEQQIQNPSPKNSYPSSNCYSGFRSLGGKFGHALVYLSLQVVPFLQLIVSKVNESLRNLGRKMESVISKLGRCWSFLLSKEEGGDVPEVRNFARKSKYLDSRVSFSYNMSSQRNSNDITDGCGRTMTWPNTQCLAVASYLVFAAPIVPRTVPSPPISYQNFMEASFTISLG